MVNINSLNHEVRNSLNNLNGQSYPGSVRGGNPPPIPQYTRDNQTNNNFSGRRNAIVPGDIPENFQRVIQQANEKRKRANTQVQKYKKETTITKVIYYFKNNK